MGAEEFQEVREPVAMEGVNLDPPFPKVLKVSNIVRRSMLWGYCETLKRLLALKSSSDGALLVYNAADLAALVAIQTAVEGTLVVDGSSQIPNAIKRYGATSGDAYSGYTAFGVTSRVVTIMAETFGSVFMFKDENGDPMDAIELAVDTGISLDLKTTAYRHINRTGGSNGTHQMIISYLAA